MFSDKFIAANDEFATFENYIPAPYLRKTFFVEDTSKRCKITICGLGLYRLFINGKEITKTFLAPYVSNPDDCLYYDAYDISSYVKSGKNVIGIILGNGMLNSIGGYIWFFEQAKFRSAPKVAFTLKIGDTTIQADTSVKVYNSPITFNDIRVGEHYDARLEVNGWSEIDFDDTTWGNAIVAECPKGEKRIADIDPILVVREEKAVKITKGDNGYIYDFGINTAGIVRLKINGHKGQEIKLIHSEIVNDGKADLSNINFIGTTKPDCNQCVIYTCKEGEQIYQPSFTYMGFRYVYVTGITDEQAKEDLLTMLVMHSNIKQVSDFWCSDENINKLYQNTLNSTLSNFYHFLTDCPQREKNGWTGDVVLGANQVMLNFAAERNLREWMQNVRKAQDESGNIPCVVPTAGWGYKWYDAPPWECGPAWDSVLVEVPYRILQYTNDDAVVRENADTIFNWINYLRQKMDADFLIAIGLGDWCQVARPGGTMFTTPVRVTDTLVSMDTCRKAKLLFERIGQNDRAKVCEKMSNELRNAFRKHCIDENLYVSGKTQTGLAMALYYGAFEEDEKTKAFKNLLTLIKEKENHFDVGVQGARVLFRVLADYGKADLARDLILNKTFPSFLYQLKLGATSLWESFFELNDRFEPIHGFPGEILSQNHFFWGDVAAFFVEYLAGIKINPVNDDFKNIVIQPCFIKGIDEVKAHRDMPYGRIAVEWKIENEEVRGCIQLPDSVQATLIYPNGRIECLHGGSNEVCYHMK